MWGWCKDPWDLWGWCKDPWDLCRRGNDSQAGVRAVQELLPGVEVRDVVGGLQAWTTTVDPSFPAY